MLRLLFFVCILFSSCINAAAPISLSLREANLPSVLSMFSQFLSINMILSPAIQGKVSLQINNVTPQAALNLLLTHNGLVATKLNNILYIEPIDELLATKAKELKWRAMSDDTVPLVSHYWKINYARAQDIAQLLQAGHSNFLSKSGQAGCDIRTNMVYARDTAQRIAVIDNFIRHSDVAVQQIALSARLVSIDNDYERKLGVNFDNSTAANAGEYSIAYAKLADGSALDVKLAALENAGHAQLISSPSLFALNQQQAVIESGDEVPYQETSESGGTAIQFKKAVLSLRVVPSILPHGQVLLQLHINQDRPSETLVLGMPTISTRQISTSALVQDGQTVVLGGIYETNEENVRRGIPFLSKLPVFGVLFKQQNTKATKRDLLIFITPRIVAQRE